MRSRVARNDRLNFVVRERIAHHTHVNERAEVGLTWTNTRYVVRPHVTKRQVPFIKAAFDCNLIGWIKIRSILTLPPAMRGHNVRILGPITRHPTSPRIPPLP